MFKNVECSEQIVKTVASIVSAMYCHNPKIFPCTEQLSPQFTMHSCPDSPSRQLADSVLKANLLLQYFPYSLFFCSLYPFCYHLPFFCCCPGGYALPVLEVKVPEILLYSLFSIIYTSTSTIYTVVDFMQQLLHDNNNALTYCLLLLHDYRQ